MARANTFTLLPLDTWAAIMGINPWEFNQVGEGFPVVNRAQCPYVWFQFPWQEDFLSREELAQTIARAEFAMAQELHYWPAPKDFVNEVHPYPRPFNRSLYGGGGTPRGQWKALQLNWGKVQGGGVLVRTAVNLAGAVVLTDNDGDGIADRFTVTVATTITNADEIALYFTSADRNGVPVAEQWRVRPVNVTLSGGNAIITGHPSLLIKPDLTTITNPDILNVSTAANFVTALEVYRLYLDTTSTAANPAQGTALWEDPACGAPPCAVEWLPVCQGARNAEMGLVSVDYLQGGLYCPPSDREPDRVALHYVAGEPLVNGQMNPSMADVVAHLATAWLPVTKCGCDRSNRILDYWRGIEAVDTEGVVGVTLKQSDDNPFGVQRGALYAWERVQQMRQLWAALA